MHISQFGSFPFSLYSICTYSWHILSMALSQRGGWVTFSSENRWLWSWWDCERRMPVALLHGAAEYESIVFNHALSYMERLWLRGMAPSITWMGLSILHHCTTFFSVLCDTHTHTHPFFCPVFLRRILWQKFEAFNRPSTGECKSMLSHAYTSLHSLTFLQSTLISSY